MPEFDSFGEFKARTESADLKEHKDALHRGLQHVARMEHVSFSEMQDEAPEEFTKIKGYVLERYRDVESQHSFMDAAGNMVDCIPFEQQSTVRAATKLGYKVRKKPARPSKVVREGEPDPASFGPSGQSVPPPLRRRATDLYGNQIYCPSGCVPIRRVTLSQISRFGKLEQFFRKAGRTGTSGHAVPSAAKSTKSRAPRGKKTAKPQAAVSVPELVDPAGFTHRHAIAVSGQGAFFGCSTWINLWGTDPTPGAFTLSQLWIIKNIRQNFVQTVESGWQVYPGKYLTPSPVLFVFFNPDNYGPRSGYLTNKDHQGFIQLSSGWPIGSPVGPVSTRGGDQQGFQMQWEMNEKGDWLLFIDEEEIGYFPAKLYQPDGGDGSPFDQVHFGGEVSSQQGQGQTGPMGSGNSPSGDGNNDFGRVAFQSNLALQKQQGDDLVAAKLTAFEPDRNFYRVSLSSSTEWGSYMFYGGDNAG
jgi:hypothetical protein